jgi:hypothetical protein
MGCGSDWSRERATLQPIASPRHATPPRPVQTHQKSSTNPLQTATVEIAKREGVCAHLASRFLLSSPPHSLTFVVAAQLASPCHTSQRHAARRLFII